MALCVQADVSLPAEGVCEGGVAPVQDVLGLHMLDANVGWAVGRYDMLAKTTNGGVSWRLKKSNLGVGTGAIGIIMYDWCEAWRTTRLAC
jgi:hypothetical protein